MNSPDNGSRNRLLAVLSHADRDLLTPNLETIALDVRHVLEAPNDPISHVYFFESGLVSVIGAAPPNHRIEVGMVGYEGMTGLSIVLGDNRSADETMVQSAGSALRISAASLREILDASRSLTATLLRYVNIFMVQSSQTALANGRGRLDQRLARWLLMWDDRIERDESHRTHDFLAAAARRTPAGRHRRPARAGRQRPDPLDARRGPHPRSPGPGARRQRLLRRPGSRI